MILRPSYQIPAVDAVGEHLQKHASTLLVLATGLGKTVCAAEIIKRTVEATGKLVLFLAHRSELIWQAKRAIEAHTGFECGIEMANERVEHSLFAKHKVVISTVQTQIAGRPIKRMQQFKPEDFALIIIDESHRAAAKSYIEIIAHYRQNPRVRVLGITATPQRADEESLGKVFESVAYNYGILDGVRDGWLVDVTQQFIKVDSLDWSECRTTAGDLNAGDVAKVVEKKENIAGICHPSLEVIFGLEPGTLTAKPLADWPAFLKSLGKVPRRTIVFTATVKQAEECCHIFNTAFPGLAEWVCGETDKDKRENLLGRFKNGQTAVVCNVGILTEGYDNPSVEVIIMGAAMKSLTRYTQQIGRATRPLPGVVDEESLNTPELRCRAIRDSAKPICIAEGTQVLTDAGLVAIENITTEMKVWDGLEFVTHSGILFHGKQPVITYAGLTATPKHQVWTKKGWQTFGECSAKQTPIAVASIGGQAIWETDGCYRTGRAGSEFSENTTASGRVRLRPKKLEGLFEPYRGESRLPIMRPTKKISPLALGKMRRRVDEVYEQKRTSLPALWSTRDSVQVCVRQRNGSVDSGESRVAQRFGAGSHRQQWSLRTGKSEVPKHSAKSVQPSRAQDCARDTRIQNSASGIQMLRRVSWKALSSWKDMEAGHRISSGEGSVQKQNLVRVYDIVNCGPRYRFNAAGLIVANCRIVDFMGNSGRHKLVNSMHVLSGDMSEEAIERAVKDAVASKKPKRVLAALSNTEKKLKAEQAERQREIERQRLLKCKAPKASYRVRDVDAFGNESFRTGERNGKGEKEIPAWVLKKLRAHQMREPANYKQAMVLYQVCKRREETMPISEHNKQRLSAIGYDVQGWTQARANRAWQEYFENDKQKPLVSKL